MIRKNKDSETIDFLYNAVAPKKTAQQSNGKKENLTPMAPEKLDNSNAMKRRNGGSFLYAGDGFAPDGGSPTKYMGANTNNSIWDSEVLTRLGEKKTGDEIIKASREQKEEIKAKKRSRDKLENVEAAINVDTRKDSTILRHSGDYNDDTNVHIPSNALSIFDNDRDFNRIPEKTAGEKMAEENRRPKEKDKTSVHRKPYTTSGIFDEMLKKLGK